MSTLKVNRIEPRTGNSVDIVGLDIPESPVKAWVSFNGTGTVAIRGSFNVSSITDNGVGNYTMNFTTAMPDANYSTLVTCVAGKGNIYAAFQLEATTSVDITTYDNDTPVDRFGINVVIFH